MHGYLRSFCGLVATNDTTTKELPLPFDKLDYIVYEYYFTVKYRQYIYQDVFFYLKLGNVSK